MLKHHDPVLGFFFGNGRELVSIVSFGPTLRYSATGSKPKWGAIHCPVTRTPSPNCAYRKVRIAWPAG